MEFLISDEEKINAVRERQRREQKLRRIKLQFREGDIEQREYEAEMGLANASLAAVQVPDEEQLVQIGDHIEGLVDAWAAHSRVPGSGVTRGRGSG